MITRRKALYVFLSSLMGTLLLVMFHRSLFVIYELLGDFFPNQQWLNMDPFLVVTADFFTMLLAMFVGGWYGVWLGLNWYKMVYEDRGVTGMFHGFLPHHWREETNPKKDKQEEILSKSVGSVPKRIVVNPRVESFDTFRSRRPEAGWNFDDVDELKTSKKPARKAPAKKKVATKKRVVKKTSNTSEKAEILPEAE